MQRRSFATASLLGVASIMSGCLSRKFNSRSSMLSSKDSFFVGRTFNDTSRREFSDKMVVLEGRLPSDLSGHAFIMGSVLPEGDDGQTSIIAGDGIFHRIDFTGEHAIWNQKLILTDSMVKWSTIGGQSLRRLPLELLGRKVTQC
ncbi:MAG: carotenoid oxygenase family protein [Silvanigrellales bacterium]|nr:carotenoid oxygenase family protein [Silvanigrellales bacterium]